MSHLVEFVHAAWSGPSARERKKLNAAELPESIEIVILDADTVPYDPAFNGAGECRLNGGPWTTVDAVLREIAEQDS